MFRGFRERMMSKTRGFNLAVVTGLLIVLLGMLIWPSVVVTRAADMGGNLHAGLDRAEGRPPGQPEQPVPAPTVTRNSADVSACGPAGTTVPHDWPMVMCEPFDDNARGWPTGADRDEMAATLLTVADGVYGWGLDVERPVLVSRIVDLEPLADFYVAFDVFVEASSGEPVEYGLRYRVPDVENGYTFLLSDAGTFAVFRHLPGESVPVLSGDTPAEVLRKGQWNRLAVQAVGPAMVLYANDREIGRVSDPFVPKGYLLLAVQAKSEGRAAVYFDNIEVRAAPPGAQIPPAPPASIAACANSPSVAPADWPIVACEPFADNRYGWRTGVGDGVLLRTTASIGGTYLCAFEARERTFWWEEPDLPPTSDFFVSVRATAKTAMDGTGYGLVFRMADYDNMFAFTVDDRQQFQVVAQVDGAWRTLLAPVAYSGIRRGEMNSLAVRGDRWHFSFYINDALVAELDDIHFKTGQVGVMILAGRNDQGHVEFDDFELRAPNGN